MEEILTLYKKKSGCIKFLDFLEDGTYKIYRVETDIAEEIKEILTLCKKDLGCIKFLEDGTYKIYRETTGIDEEIKEIKEIKEFLNKLKRFELLQCL